jgi:hypothetical protein
MTDWDPLSEQIHNTMRVIDRVHTASRQLREDANLETFDNLRAQMQDLTENVTQIEALFNNPETFSRDELEVWLSKEFTIKLPDDHRPSETPNITP